MKHHARSEDGVRRFLCERVAACIEAMPESIDTQRDFSSYGLQSTDVIPIAGELEELLGERLSPTLLFEYPTIDALAEHLARSRVTGEVPEAEQPVAEQAHSVAEQAGQTTVEPIAIVGVGCRYPGAKDPCEYWSLLAAGRDAVSEVPSERWSADRFYSADPKAPGKSRSRWGGFVEGVALFDAAFFGIGAKEADRIDPQQRLALEVAWEALENAGELPPKLEGSQTGVFVGISHTEYSRIQFRRYTSVDAFAASGNSLSLAANRISYAFDLRGPSLAVDTACSSSLVALHLACESLRRGESSRALVLGANLTVVPEASIALSKAGLLAADGRCKPFDRRADGYVRGEGVGALVLKRLSAAMSDGNTILAVVRGTAVTQDGKSNGMLAPNQRAQERAIEEACRRAGVSPGEIDYVEAHGTGTYLGDAIEAKALGATVGRHRASGVPCKIGSVKSNLGHLESASGIASVIKVAMALSRGTIPASLHFDEPNPEIDFAALGLEVQTALGPWPRSGGPRLAGVNSFGFGGANAHVVLEAYDEPGEPSSLRPSPDSHLTQLVTLSARSVESLSELSRAVACALEDAQGRDEAPELYGVAHTLATRRCHHQQRLAVVSRDCTELTTQLRAFAEGKPLAHACVGQLAPGQRPRVGLVFSGQGVRRVPDVRALMQRFPVYAEALQLCDAEFRRLGGAPILDAGGWPASPQLEDTSVCQPLIFSLQVATLRLLESWGVQVAGVLGHSVGEVAAALGSGALSLADACRVVFHRSRLMQRCKGRGGMLALQCSESEAESFSTGGQLSMAAVNGPGSVVLSGDLSALHRARSQASLAGVTSSLLPCAYPFHSRQIAKEVEPLRDLLGAIRPCASTTPMVSSVTGRQVTGSELDAQYWLENAAKPVRFRDAVASLANLGCNLFVEISAQPLLQRDVDSCLTGREASCWSAYPRDLDAHDALLELAGALYAAGVDLDFAAIFQQPARVVALPSRPWRHSDHWFRSEESAALPEPGGLLGTHVELVHSPGAHVFSRHADRAALLAEVPSPAGSLHTSWVLAEALVHAAQRAGARLPLALTNLTTSELPESGRSFDMQTSALPQWAGRWSVDIHLRQTESGGVFGQWHKAAAAGVSEVREPDLPCETLGSAETGSAWTAELGERANARQVLRAAFQAEGCLWLELDFPGVSSAVGVVPWGLDACCQLALTELRQSGVLAELRGVCRIETLTVRATLGARVRARLRWRDGSDDRTPLLDIRLADPEGRVAVEALGIEFERCREVSEQLTGSETLAFADLVWRETALPAARDQESKREAGWLVLADRRGSGVAIAEALRARGCPCTLRFLQDGAESGASVDWRSDSALQALLSNQPLSGVIVTAMVDMPEFDPSDRRALVQSQSTGCESTVRIVRALCGLGGQAPRLWLVTRGARAVVSEDADRLAVAQSPLWGLGRGVDQELPALRCTLLDLDPEQPDFGASAMVAELLHDADEREVAYRARKRYVLRLREREAPAPVAPLRPRDDASYLVTGGLGGIGFEVVRWLAERGAKCVVLLGRRPPSESRRRDVEAFRAAGMRCEVLPVDVADYPRLQAAFSRLRPSLPPVRGVFHAAGVVDSRALVDLDEASLGSVFLPKVFGTCNLHRLTQQEPLDFFVLFSSVSSVLGTPGQANYNAANLFMDTFAHWARARGCPAISINWGPWAEVGMLARTSTELTRKAAKNRVKLISPDRGIALLERLVVHRPVQLSVMPWSIPTLLQHYPAGTSRCLFRDLSSDLEAETAAGTDNSLSERPLLRQAYVEPSTDAERVIAAVWREFLRLERVGVLDNFFELGGDSILGARIVAEVNERFGVSLDLRESFNVFTVRELANAVQLRLEEKLAALSDAEVEQLLRSESP